ncbi:uncharacterized protein LOC105192287 [Harpegnathos saltator]|uniref:Chitin-binding type-2 domain-containing protein n=1 Tax=Harpegnathos saltator TaxID=610380 RepID=E2B8M9_HARSA|nr:uncharacterized protein LOC105192287 [Harpegnathos saltator]EFN87935.1 hypothetical protein EAI_17189 [Harpegnathos saltator]
MGRYQCTKLAVLLTFVFGCNVTSGQLLLPFAGNVVIKRNDTVTCDSARMCHECDKVRLCIQANGRWVQQAIVTCDPDSDERWCNAGKCSKTPLSRCVKDSTDFTCPDIDGKYPDSSSCTRYHICTEGIRRTNYCPPNNVYDHELGDCKLRRRNSDCVQFKCDAQSKNGEPIVYPQDDRIYGRCIFGKVYILGRCQDYERYNLLTEECERYCRSVGPQPPNAGKCGKYILCAEMSPGTYQPVEMSCGCNQAYDEKEGRCVTDAPCVKETPDIWCKPTPGTNDESETSNSSDDVDENQQPRSVQRRSILSFMNRFGINRHNNNDSSGNMPATLINNNNSGDNDNPVSDGDDVIDGNLIKSGNDGDTAVYDATENPEIKQRENFIRFVIDWIIRIVIGGPVVGPVR